MCYVERVPYHTSNKVCIRQSPRNVIALGHRVFKPIGGRNNGVVGIEKGKAQTCKTEDSDADKLASSDASGGRGGGGIGSHGGGLLIHCEYPAIHTHQEGPLSRSGRAERAHRSPLLT